MYTLWKTLQLAPTLWLLPQAISGHPLSAFLPNSHTDWSVAIVESTLARFTPQTFDGWGYTAGLYLLGQYEVYQRTKEPRYLQFIQDWADRFVDDDGHLNITLDSLDSMQAGNVLLTLHQETAKEKYRKAATQIRDRLKSYPRTEDNGFWHATTWEHELWADGTFMVNPFLIRFGHMFGEKGYVNDETTQQLIVYGEHLQVKNGLLQHAYDESRSEGWSDPRTGRSAEQWCRAIGWYGLAVLDILELLPRDHPNRNHLLSNLRHYVAGVKTTQDRKSGRWFQVANKPDLEENWTETSCSAMFTYTLSQSLQRGYISWKYLPNLVRGYMGVLGRIDKGTDGLTNVRDICVGTNVGDLQWYLDRPRATNDLHGLGAVLLMNEKVLYGWG